MAASYYFQTKLAKMGWEVVVAAPAGGNASPYSDAGVRTVEIEKSENWFAALKQVWNNVRPDIIHVFIHAGCGVYPFFLRSRLSRSRFVLDIRSPLLRRGMVRNLVRIKNRLEVIKYDVVLSHSIESGRTVVGGGRQLLAVPPGFDRAIVPELREKSYSGGEVRLLYAGSMDIKRKLEGMIRGVAVARDKAELMLDLYGDGNDMPRLMDLTKKLGAEGYIHFKGRVERNLLYELIPSYHAGLSYIPRELYDVAPALKTLEYLACGIPVIATDTSGNRQFVADGINGIIVSEGYEPFGQGIDRFRRSGLINKDGRVLRTSVDQYDWQTIVSNYLLPVYYRLLEVQAPGRTVS